jgi:septum site-determining protein MinD
VVTNPEVSSVRDSDRIIGMLDARTCKAENGETVDKHVLITRYDAGRAARGEMMSVDDVLEILSLPLIGIVPESESVLQASNVGTPITLADPTSMAAQAYHDAARRLKGETVKMTIPTNKKGLFGGLFRRAA